MPIDGFYPDYPDWPFSPDGAHHRDYHDKGPYHHHPLNPPNDMWRRDMRCADECDDQLAVFSSVGRGLKGDGYRVRVIEGDAGETFLEGLREDAATGEYVRDWVSDNIDGGTLTYKCTMHPFTSPKTFTITFSYHKTGDEEDDWVWTTPSIPYIWGDEDINVPSIDAFDGLQEQIDALTEQNAQQALAISALEGRVAALEADCDELQDEVAALKRSRADILNHIFGQRHDHSGNQGWAHYLGGDVWLGPGTETSDGRMWRPGEIYWNYEAPDTVWSQQTYIPVGNINVYGGYEPSSSTTGMSAVGVIRTHETAQEGDIWARLDANNSLTGMWQMYRASWTRVAELND